MMMAAISFTILQIHTNSNGVMGNSIAGNPYISSILIIIDGKRKKMVATTTIIISNNDNMVRIIRY